jgi:4-hydroxybenzoate polyprenyltransferase
MCYHSRVARAVAYLLSGAAVLGVLLLLATKTIDSWVFFATYVLVDAVSLWVTLQVARRDGRRPVPWLLLTAVIGPLAWIVMVATTPPDQRSGLSGPSDPSG